MIRKPDLTEVPEYFVYYTNLVPENDLIQALENSFIKTKTLFESIPSEKEHYAYADGKWAIIQILQHLIDTERIFTYRALRFSRNDQTDLPGYDENWFAKYDNSKNLNIKQLLEEYTLVRQATRLLFANMSEAMLDTYGTANSMSSTPRALAYIIAGHELHHCKILNERYL